jgi:DNA replication licensing factor MCM4
MVIRTSAVIPDLSEAYFECVDCHNGVIVGIERGRILEPAKCANCNMRNTMTIIHNRCRYVDKQTIKLQETPDSIPEGSTPQTVQLTVHASLVDATAPGDKVFVTGVYRVNAIRPTGGQRTLKQIYKTCSS